MKTQIPLSFPVNESMKSDDFMPLTSNQEALDMINRFPDWPYPVLIVYGEKGCGKTHILNMWQEKSSNLGYALDDANKIFGSKELEEKLFHDFNQAKENGTFILMTMERPVSQYNIGLPDLASRLRAAPQIEIKSPDDVALQSVLIKLFHDRQLKIEPGVVSYIIPRIERSFASVRSLVSKIDQHSMSKKRSVTVPLVREILGHDPEII